MLDVLRAKSRSVLTYILFGIIIIVFVVSFGPGSQGCQVQSLAQTQAVEIDGYVVTAGDYEAHYANLLRTYQSRVGGSFTRELAEQLGLRNVAMNQLIDRRLVVQEARRRGLRVTPDEVNKLVWSLPAFQDNGTFSLDLYRQRTRQAYGSESRFEEQLVDDLLFQKMMALLYENAQVSEEEIRDAWLADADRVDVVFVRFPLAAARKDVKVTDAQVAEFVKSHPQDVKKVYESDPSRWEVKKRVKAAHILVKVPEGAPAAQDEAARKRAEELAARVKGGESFAAVAKKSSEDGSTKSKGGDLGFFGPGSMAKPFEDAAFAMKPGEVSAPVKTRQGWHVIQVQEVQEGRKLSMAEVEQKIAREFLESEAATRIAHKAAEEALKKVGKKNLVDVFPSSTSAEAKKGAPMLGGELLVWRDTGPFSPSTSGNAPGLGVSPELVRAAAQSSSGKLLPGVYPATGGPVIAQVRTRLRPDPAAYGQKREEFAARMRERRKNELEQAWLKSLRDGASVKINDAMLKAGAPEQQG